MRSSEMQFANGAPVDECARRGGNLLLSRGRRVAAALIPARAALIGG